MGSRSLASSADIAKKDDIAQLLGDAMRAFGRIDIVVNNAMKIVPGKLEELSEDAWDTTMNIGLKGAFLVSQAAARQMIAQKSGCIVNIASIAGLFPYNWAGSYSVAKAGLLMRTKLQALEWAPYGIRANAITPGYIRTPGTEAMYADPEIYEGRRKGVPMGRVGGGEDVSGVAVFLASDYLTESKAKAAKIQIESFGSALDLFFLDTGRYPNGSEGLAALVQRPGSIAAWNGPYLKGGAVPTDPWGKPYVYRAPGPHGTYDLSSHGADGQEGGTGTGADITNWTR